MSCKEKSFIKEWKGKKVYGKVGKVYGKGSKVTLAAENNFVLFPLFPTFCLRGNKFQHNKNIFPYA